MIALAVGFVCAAAVDWLACAWQRAREDGAVWRGVGLACALEAAGFLPFWLAIQGDSPEVALAAIAGAGVGTFVGFRRGSARRVPNP